MDELGEQHTRPRSEAKEQQVLVHEHRAVLTGRGLSDAMAKEARDKKVKELEEVATIRIAGWELPFQVEGHHGRTLRDL